MKSGFIAIFSLFLLAATLALVVVYLNLTVNSQIPEGKSGRGDIDILSLFKLPSKSVEQKKDDPYEQVKPSENFSVNPAQENTNPSSGAQNPSTVSSTSMKPPFSLDSVSSHHD